MTFGVNKARADGRKPLVDGLKRLGRPGLSLVLALTMLASVLLLIVIVPPLPGYDPHRQNLLFGLEPPFVNSAHILGTDALGRDMLSRLSLAAVVSLGIAGGAVLISATLGLGLGLLAGWRRGRIETLLMAVANVQLSIPVVLLLIVLVATFGSSPMLLVMLLGLTNWVSYGRMVRSMVVSLREREFIVAAATAGGSGWWIMRKHLLPNVLPQVLVLAAFEMGVIITVESSLSFLGLGVQPPTPSLGLMINEGQRYLQSNPSLTLFPAVVIFLMIGGFQFAVQSLGRPLHRG